MRDNKIVFFMKVYKSVSLRNFSYSISAIEGITNMLKLSVAFLLVALALSASARPQLIAARALRHARTAHNALKRKSIFDSDERPVPERPSNNVDFLQTKDEDDDVDNQFEKEFARGLKNFESEIMKALVQGLEEFLVSSFDAEHGAKIREIFNKYPEPNYNDESSVDAYLEKVGNDMKAYIESKGLEDPFGSSEEDEDSSDNEV